MQNFPVNKSWLTYKIILSEFWEELTFLILYSLNLDALHIWQRQIHKNNCIDPSKDTILHLIRVNSS